MASRRGLIALPLNWRLAPPQLQIVLDNRVRAP
jgi:hypothetical protein